MGESVYTLESIWDVELSRSDLVASVMGSLSCLCAWKVAWIRRGRLRRRLMLYDG